MCNKPFLVLVWKTRSDADPWLGDPDYEQDYDTFKEAEKDYDGQLKFGHKMLMKYESPEPDADGEVLCENDIGDED